MTLCCLCACCAAQTGDPTGTGRGGDSVYGLMYGSQATSFEVEPRKHLTHNKVGVVSMAGGMGSADG
jgi:peptidyl-prolyl cis-trans isomerase-like 4